MATNNKYKYFGNYFLPLRGAFGKILTGTTVFGLLKISAIVKLRKWRASLFHKKWRAHANRW